MSIPLEPWKDGSVKNTIIDFVTKVTNENGQDYVPPPDRIAAFDNDGTLWCEQPVPVQFFFALDRMKVLATLQPVWRL
jgi:hypothetical protein